ncbi:hypothetical protein Mal4_10600 [Maioricimonas rarisocia]|uniref:Uncharacterized protein n=1 Tax=Maioricimonas rarisocia TaxID=2528026 RepID=A0A517Z2Q6_9PLAN|nr:hypothetical protein Mal4_10600 [Maioricimonas rarisocia]
MSPRSSNPDPQPDVYVGLLFVSVAALISGCIFLAMELNRYDWQFPS